MRRSAVFYWWSLWWSPPRLQTCRGGVPPWRLKHIKTSGTLTRTYIIRQHILFHLNTSHWLLDRWSVVTETAHAKTDGNTLFCFLRGIPSDLIHQSYKWIPFFCLHQTLLLLSGLDALKTQQQLCRLVAQTTTDKIINDNPKIIYWKKLVQASKLWEVFLCPLW